jgi:putative ABC transport system permease protein
MPWNISNSSSRYSLTPDLNATTQQLSTHRVGYEYSETMGIPVQLGRDFSRDRSTDQIPPIGQLNSASGPYAVMLDALAAASFGWSNPQEAIGQSIYSHYGPPNTTQEFTVELNVIGILGERRYEFIDFSSFGSAGNLYLLRPGSAPYFLVKLARSNLNDGLQHIDATWNSLVPDTPLQREFVDDLFYASYTLFLSVSVSIGALSIFGFLVASIGLLGNATFITNIRSKEVGIRKVMGASSGRLLRMLLLDFAKPVLIANALAWPVGYLLGSAYTSFFSATVNITLMPFLVSLSLSAFIAFAAVFSQSWKSSRVRPAMTLRYE